MKIERYSTTTGSFSLTNSASTTARLQFGACAGGIIIVDSVASATSIAWHAALTPTDTPAPVYVDGAALTTAISASRAYPVPDALFASAFVVPVTDAGTASIRLSTKG